MQSELEILREALEDVEVQVLPKTEHLDESFHAWSQNEKDALTLACASRRPLLIRGEPGTGKTQIARAASELLGWRLHFVAIHPRFEASDLVYRFDAVKRLADAQAGDRKVNRNDYWEPGPLWKAFDWNSARRFGSCRRETEAPRGHVVLLDEIDKADSDVPNSLLEVLGQRTFAIPQLGLRIGNPDTQPPLILITTNEERELPPAFLRRCIVLSLEPSRTATYEDWLVERGEAHFGGRAPGTQRLIEIGILQNAAAQLAEDRSNAESAGLQPPGLAEYIDLLNALHRLAPGDAEAQAQWMKDLSAYAFVKHTRQEGRPEIAQSRPFSGAGTKVEPGR